MKINLYAKGLVLTDTETSYINSKMEKLSSMAKRIQDSSSEIRVDVIHEQTRDKSDSITCVITMYVPGSTLRVKENGTKVNEATDKAQEAMFPQIEKYKSKHKK